jgi:trk-type K+ transport systems, membrane components
MNYRVISYILGWVLGLEALFLTVSAAVGGLYGERTALSFLYAALICAALGIPAVVRKPRRMTFFMKEGFVTVALCWIIFSIFGALPFVFSGEIPHFTDALFETVSGFTTTGASVVPDVEALSHCTLFWRSFTHWIGGMGVLVFLLAILPMAGGSQMYLMQAESPGPSVGKLVPKTRHTALILYSLYILLSIAEFVFLLCGGMSAFDAVNTTFATAGTGGFGIRNSSMTDFSPYIQWVVAVFMMLFGINFNLYFLVLVGRGRQALKSEELRTYLGVIAAATLLIVLNTRTAGVRLGDTVRHAFFQVSSIITTTGFATCDFDLWPSLSKCVLVLLMLIGACAGSTGGGIKISRVLILIKRAGEELHKFIFPNSVTKIRLEKKILDREVIHTTSAFLIVYVFIFAVSTLLVSIEGHDLETCFTAVAATFNNIGPGLSIVGPTRNFGFFSDFTKYVLIFDMLAGRLELFPMLILFSPRTWLKNPPLLRKHN